MGEELDLEIDLGELAKHRCDCCERASETVHGFLYDRSGTTSVYFAGYTFGHPERRVNIVLSVGGWGEGTAPADRQAIALQVFPSAQGMLFTFPPAEASPWYGEELLGSMRNPEQIPEEERRLFRDMARVVLAKDPRVAYYLGCG